ncbi:MAG: hypothetical protein K1060chlam1_01249 [Candidatus Anoxychlamydiales bacterium]|nr:hypothetical protein [Candidatus Anoxychlamydiales bacterium]
MSIPSLYNIAAFQVAKNHIPAIPEQIPDEVRSFLHIIRKCLVFKKPHLQNDNVFLKLSHNFTDKMHKELIITAIYFGIFKPNSFFLLLDDILYKQLQVANDNGHLETVKALKKFGIEKK